MLLQRPLLASGHTPARSIRAAVVCNSSSAVKPDWRTKCELLERGPEDVTRHAAPLMASVGNGFAHAANLFVHAARIQLILELAWQAKVDGSL